MAMLCELSPAHAPAAYSAERASVLVPGPEEHARPHVANESQVVHVADVARRKPANAIRARSGCRTWEVYERFWQSQCSRRTN